MFYFTDQDPNFRIKGSRDPLGFQPLWQTLGRTVVKYLSTVSNNLKDFQILAYAWYFYGDNDPKGFLPFFYKVEQAYGFARGLYLSSDAFNGIDFVRKNLNNEVFTFSTRAQHTLLSNQKSYGIFGKYNRPFNEMNFKGQADFYEVMESSIRQKVDFPTLHDSMKRLLNEEVCQFKKDELKIFADSIASITTTERAFYKNHILLTQDNHIQNELFKVLMNHRELLLMQPFNLHHFIGHVLSLPISQDLASKFIEISKSETVLTPFLYLFKTIQSSPTWEMSQLAEEPIFDSFPSELNHTFSLDVIKTLNESLSQAPTSRINHAILRNASVSENRGNAAWIKREENKIITCYADGCRRIVSFDSTLDFEHDYFLPTYISMYKQIMGSNA